MPATLLQPPPMIGPEHGCVASYVPDEIAEAIDEWEHAHERAEMAYAASRSLREHDRRAADLKFSEYLSWFQAAVERRHDLEQLVPVGPGWYPHAGHVWGWAKRSACGLQLVREPAWTRLDGPGAAEMRRKWNTSLRRKEDADRAAAASMQRAWGRLPAS